MKSLLQVGILYAIAWPCFGQSKPVASVDVYINDHDDSALLLGPGKAMAADIYRKIGVRINWRAGKLPEGQAAFGIRTVERAPETASPQALAASVVGLSGVEITVYKDRVRRFLADHPTLHEAAAGYVLAHELAHAMQGVPHHSDSGILKATWSKDDFKEMMYHKLAFTPHDIALIHQGLASRIGSELVSPTPPK